MLLMIPLLLPSVPELIVMAVLLAVFVTAWRWTAHRMGLGDRVERVREARDEPVRILREVRRGVDRIDERMDMMEMAVKDLRARLEAVESAEHIAGSR